MQSKHETEMNRRGFIHQAAGAATLATTVAWTARSYGNIVGANSRIRHALIGAGGMGEYHLRALASLQDKDNLEPVAVADCWTRRAAKGADLLAEGPQRDDSNPAAQSDRKFPVQAMSDYRRLLDLKDLDYVTIASPEHRHHDMTIDALDAGLAVYCEKPMTHSIPEGMTVAQKVEQTGLPLQIGVQAMSDDSYESAARAIEEGVIGQVVQAQIEYVRRYGAQGPWRVPDLDENMTLPDDLNWTDWLGSAPKIPWNPHHYFEWRNYSHYSGGVCTDLFIHRITRIIKACNLMFPRRVVGMGGIWQWPDGRDLPDNFEMICEYPRGMTVYVLGTMSNRVGVDHLIRGYRGTLFFNKTGWVAQDKDGKELASHTKTGAEDIHLHHTNLHNHLRDRSVPLNCPVELGLAGVVAVNMANESWRSGQMMGWDKQRQDMVPAHSLGRQDHYPERQAT